MDIKLPERICEYCGNEMEHLGEKFERDEIEITPAKVVHVKIYQEEEQPIVVKDIQAQRTKVH